MPLTYSISQGIQFISLQSFPNADLTNDCLFDSQYLQPSIWPATP